MGTISPFKQGPCLTFFATDPVLD